MAQIHSSQRLNQLGTQAIALREGGKLRRMADILRGNLAVNLAVALALAVGFFHGWLKLQIRHPATTFAFDLLLLVALVLVYLRCGSLAKFIPPGPVGRALMALYTLCALYLPFALLPGTPPLLVALVAVRTWCFGTLMFCVGYHTIRSPLQMRVYYYVIIGLAVATALYGLQQTPEEIARMMEQDEYYARRFTGQGYVTSVGVEARIFSTFVSSGAFGGTMAASMVFALALLTDRRMKRPMQVVLLLAMVPMGWGILASGARSAFAAMAVGLLAVPLIRRQYTLAVGALALGAAGLWLKGLMTSGAAVERFASLADADSVAERVLFPALIGFSYIIDGHPFGGGLGKAGFVPMFLEGRTGYTDYVRADGDLGTLLIELGLPGAAVFGWLLWTASKANWHYVRRHLDSPIGALALAGAINFYISLLTFPIGSPYIGIPLGVMVWFMIGGTQKLVELHEAELARPAGSEAVEPPPRPRLGVTGNPIPWATAPPRRVPAGPPGPGAAPAENAGSHAAAAPVRSTSSLYSAAADAKPARPVKRFLYSEPAAAEPPAAPSPAAAPNAPVRKRFLFSAPGKR